MMRNVLSFLFLMMVSISAMAGYVEPPYPITYGGTGATTQQGAINALAGSVTTGSFLRGNGTNVVMSALQAGDITAGLTYTPANINLSNIASVALSSDLICATSGSCKLGSALKPFGDSFLNTVKDASSVISVDFLNRLLVNASGVTVGNFAGSVFATPALELTGSVSGTLDFHAAATTTSYSLTYPAAQGASGQYLSNNGSGVLTWVSLASGNYTVVDGGNSAYAILAANHVVRSTTTLTADRAYTLDLCTAGNIGEEHMIKNLPSQTKNITLTAAGSDLIDGSATSTILPGESLTVICAAYGAAGTWDLN